jgi:NAD(P)-dependent dehydrogenase (short-subunit alcohol dehydrogenase family)
MLQARAHRVNCVAPGLIRTPMTETMTDAKQAKDASLKVWPCAACWSPVSLSPVRLHVHCVPL